MFYCCEAKFCDYLMYLSRIAALYDNLDSPTVYNRIHNTFGQLMSASCFKLGLRRSDEIEIIASSCSWIM